jgi:hypothetical protein
MAAGTGTAIIDFGSVHPGVNEASVVVTGIPGILATDHVEAWFMSESTDDHTAADHRMADTMIDLTAGDVVAGTGFTIYATSWQKFTGTFKVHFVWAS